MTSPFPSSSSAPGQGQLVVRILPQAISGLTKITYQYPLKLISPSPTIHQKSVLVFLLTYGGGLVGGDQVHLQVTVHPKAKLSIVTQGHTKIFKSPSHEIVTRQKLQVSVGPDAAICLLPDPVQPYEGSVYAQSQIFTLEESASICLLDWVSQGRSARGENWDFGSWKGRNEIWSAEGPGVKKRLLLRDSVILHGDQEGSPDILLKQKMYGLGIFGTLILKGPLIEELASFFITEFAAQPRIGARDFRSEEDKTEDGKMTLSTVEQWRRDRLRQETENGILWSAAKVRTCTVVKFGAGSVEAARHWLSSMLLKEGTIERVFGDEALMCVR